MNTKRISPLAAALAFLLLFSSCSPSPSPSPVDTSLIRSSDFENIRVVVGTEVENAVDVEYYLNIVVMNFFEELDNNYEEPSDYGLTYDRPLKDQPCMLLASGTWFDYFLEQALYRLHIECAIVNEFRALKMKLTEEDELQIEYNQDYFLREFYGNEESLLEFLHEAFGSGMTTETYYKMVERDVTVGRWKKNYVKDHKYSDQEMEEVVPEEDRELGNYPSVNVRHIMLESEDMAQEILEIWQEDPTEENFSRLAREYSFDDDSLPYGGLYSQILRDEMVLQFEEWCFDESRQPGDTGIIQTDYGYHVMYFVSTDELAWKIWALSVLDNDLLLAAVEQLIVKYPMEQ